MNREQYIALIRGGLSKDASANFADSKQAFINATYEYFKIDPNTSIRHLSKAVDFTIIEEQIADLLPKQVENILGEVCDVKTFARNEEMKFVIRNKGQRRQQLVVLPGARGGVYKSRRWDADVVSISTEVFTAGVRFGVEDILLGDYSLGELMDNILDGIMVQIFGRIVAAMRTIKTKAPSANINTGDLNDATPATKATNWANFMNLVHIVRSYGDPVIMCFDHAAERFFNAMPTSTAYPNISMKDAEEWRNSGYVGIWRGVRILRLPNFLLDADNTTWAFAENDIFIVPTASKPLCVGFQGTGYLAEYQGPTGQIENNYHQIAGVGVVLCNNICIYTDTGLSAYNTDNIGTKY